MIVEYFNCLWIAFPVMYFTFKLFRDDDMLDFKPCIFESLPKQMLHTFVSTAAVVFSGIVSVLWLHDVCYR